MWKTALTLAVGIYFTSPAAHASLDSDAADCLAGLIGCGAPLTSIHSLERYRPPTFAVPRERPLLDSEWMFNVDGEPKTFVRAYAWKSSGQAIALYGRPYLADGTWMVDFYVQALMTPGERHLWRMPATDFFEGIGQKSPDW